MACVLSAVVACGAYAVVVPLRISQAIGVELPPRMLAVALASSLVLHLFVFAAIFLAVMTVMGASRLIRDDASSEHRLIVLLLAACTTLVLYLLVCASIAFTGRDGWAACAALAVAVAAVWANVARLRSRSQAGSRQSIDSLELFSAPVAGVRSRAPAISVLVVIPFIAYMLVDAVRQFDWNFLLQKLSVLMVWLLTFAASYALIGEQRRRRAPTMVLAGVPLLVLALYHGFAWMNPQTAIDRYVAVDASFRLIRDMRTAQSSETAAYYAFLHSHTLLAPRQIQPPDIDFVQPLRPADGRKPSIFLIIVDSMRRDYLSVYNPQVAFTARIGELAADSFVFERAFTRYAGTALAIPSIFGGGMVPHMVLQKEFVRRNTLLKLLDVNDYLRVMDIDTHVVDLVPRDGRLVELDRGKGTMEIDLCGTIDELERKLPKDRARPAFFYSLPQNVHIAVATERKVPAGETYPAGFDPRIASSLHRVDGCIGGLLDYLKREQLYDDSVIIVTSDHGDSLGEEGRWGHAYFIYPEVMNIPLIVHLPSWLKARVRTDLDAVVFSTDITPSLYVLLGYQPEDLGPLFGQSFFTPRDGDSSRRRRGMFLLASSYGAVYGAVAQNGRRMYAVDAVGGVEYAVDVSRPSGSLAVTPSMTAFNRQFIKQQLAALAAVYHYQP